MAADKRQNLSFLDSLAIVAGGIAGGALGWFWGQGGLRALSDRWGHLGPDQRGPILLSYLILGWIAGTFITYIATRIWHHFRRKREVEGNEPGKDR